MKPKPSDTVATERTAETAAVRSSDMVRCLGCGNEIDGEVCWCGDLMKAHNAYCGHNPVPMGCDCGRCKLPDDLNVYMTPNTHLGAGAQMPKEAK